LRALMMSQGRNISRERPGEEIPKITARRKNVTKEKKSGQQKRTRRKLGKGIPAGSPSSQEVFAGILGKETITQLVPGKKPRKVTSPQQQNKKGGTNRGCSGEQGAIPKETRADILVQGNAALPINGKRSNKKKGDSSHKTSEKEGEGNRTFPPVFYQRGGGRKRLGGTEKETEKEKTRAPPPQRTGTEGFPP